MRESGRGLATGSAAYSYSLNAVTVVSSLGPVYIQLFDIYDIRRERSPLSENSGSDCCYD